MKCFLLCKPKVMIVIETKRRFRDAARIRIALPNGMVEDWINDEARSKGVLILACQLLLADDDVNFVLLLFAFDFNIVRMFKHVGKHVVCNNSTFSI